jgi:hypothetical protein
LQLAVKKGAPFEARAGRGASQYVLDVSDISRDQREMRQLLDRPLVRLPLTFGVNGHRTVTVINVMLKGMWFSSVIVPLTSPGDPRLLKEPFSMWTI